MLKVKVNFIFWEHETPLVEPDGSSSYGNFDLSDPDEAQFIDNMIADMNARIRDINIPNNNNCLVATDSDFGQHLPDARIEFDVEKYVIRDSYLWNIQNATDGAFYCPTAWAAEYTDRAFQKLAQAGVRDGIHVFFGQEGTPYQRLLVDGDVSIVNGNFSSFASSTDCSEFPGEQGNLNQRQRVAMTNEYLAYRFKQLADSDPNDGMVSFYDFYNASRVTVHELGHSLSLGHVQTCDENIMHDLEDNGAGPRNFLTPTQLGEMHRSLYIESARQHVVCEIGGVQPRYIVDDQTWAFDTKMYSDLVLEPGASLTICGNLYMPDGGRIIVKNGARLIIDGGLVSLNREEYENCPDAFWQGIFVIGNPDRIHANVDVFNLLPDDPGVVLLSNQATLERARVAITAANDFRRAGTPPPPGQPSPATPETALYGGIVQAENAIFRNNIIGVSIANYGFDNASFFSGCQFFSDDESARFGVMVHRSRNIDFNDCTFSQINGTGISVNNGQVNVLRGNTFSDSDYGIYGVGFDPLGETIIVGAEDEDLNRNEFNTNGVGIYAGGVYNIEIYSNDFRNNNFGVNISGETGFFIKGNDYEDHIVAENYENTGEININKSECNNYQDAGYGLRFLGDNLSVAFDGNNFERVDLSQGNFPNIDVYLREGTQNGNTVLGRLKTQGSTSNGAENDFSGFGFIPDNSPDIRTKTSSFAGQYLTEQFFYYSPIVAHQDFVPACSLNNPCTGEVNNFYHFFITEPVIDTPCGTDGFTGDGNECTSKECLNSYNNNLATVAANWDNNARSGILNLINSGQTFQSAQHLNAASPLVSEEVLTALVQSNNFTTAAKAQLLAANVPLSSSLLALAQSTLSSSQWNQLLYKQQQEPHSARVMQILQYQQAEQRKNQALLATASYLYSHGTVSDAVDVLVQDGTRLAKRALISLYLKEGNQVAVANVLAAYPTVTSSDQEYHYVIDAAILMVNEQALTTGLEADLLAVAEEEGPFSGYAQSILLESHNKLFSPDLPIPALQALQAEPITEQPSASMMTTKATDLETREHLLISPNPASNSVTIEFPTSQASVPLELIDLQGRIIFSTLFTDKQQINLQGLPEGLVLVRLHLPDRVVSQKLLIQK
ncbi:T9SS type A sorting domain-containing protein [Lewinella sp. LCG006]|uniref:T9SS type A sorting domain-containing protein n=1 Tax=Lewinella sp. LCG006 TaxID=3231911 RepID=UPI00345FC07F